MRRIFNVSIFCSLLLAIIAFILMMTTKAIILDFMKLPELDIKGTDAIFGMGKSIITTPNPAPLALAAWIIGIIGILFLLICVVWPLLGGKVYPRYMGIQKIFVAICFILCGIFIFNTIPSFDSNNPTFDAELYKLGDGWIASAILYLLAGLFVAISSYPDIKMED